MPALSSSLPPNSSDFSRFTQKVQASHSYHTVRTCLLLSRLLLLPPVGFEVVPLCLSRAKRPFWALRLLPQMSPRFQRQFLSRLRTGFLRDLRPWPGQC